MEAPALLTPRLAPRLALAALLAAIACGCAVVPAPGAPEAWATVRGHVRLAGADAGARPLLQVSVNPRLFPAKGHEVAWLRVFLTRLDVEGSPEREVGLLPGIAAPIELTQLRPNAVYRVRLAAQDENDQALDDNVQDAQDPELPGACETDVAVGNQLEQSGLSFRLKLQDAAFSGQSEGQVSVTPGQVVSGIEAIGLPAVVVTPGYQSFTNPAFLRVESDLYLAETNGANLTVPGGIPGYACHEGQIITPYDSGSTQLINLGAGPVNLPVYFSPYLSRCNGATPQ